MGAPEAVSEREGVTAEAYGSEGRSHTVAADQRLELKSSQGQA